MKTKQTNAAAAPAKAQHTPGPYRAVGRKIFDGVNQLPIAETYEPFYRRGDQPIQNPLDVAVANAEFIALACNSHPALAEALHECITEDGAAAWRNARFAGQRLEAISNLARAALALAEAGNSHPRTPRHYPGRGTDDAQVAGL